MSEDPSRNAHGDEPTMPGLVPPPPGPWTAPQQSTPINGPFPPAPPAPHQQMPPPVSPHPVSPQPVSPQAMPQPPVPEQPEQPWAQPEQQPWAQPQAQPPQWGPQQPPSSPLPPWDAVHPNSGTPYWTGNPTSSPPQSGAPAWATDPHDERQAAPRQPAQAKGKGGRAGLIAALIVLPLAFGAGGFFIGKSQGGRTTPETKPSAGASLAPFEAAQSAINKSKFSGDLSAIAAPWLADAGGCVTNTEPGGPKLPADEKAHVFCRYGGVSVHFASYKASTQRDAARGWRQQLSVQNGSLAQGMELPARKNGGVTGMPGTYVEYALKGNDGQVYCGIWWDRENELSAVYMEALCQQTLAGSWVPLRDLWARHS